jgi:hypothetical protein
MKEKTVNNIINKNKRYIIKNVYSSKHPFKIDLIHDTALALNKYIFNLGDVKDVEVINDTKGHLNLKYFLNDFQDMCFETDKNGLATIIKYDWMPNEKIDLRRRDISFLKNRVREEIRKPLEHRKEIASWNGFDPENNFIWKRKYINFFNYSPGIFFEYSPISGVLGDILIEEDQLKLKLENEKYEFVQNTISQWNKAYKVLKPVYDKLDKNYPKWMDIFKEKNKVDLNKKNKIKEISDKLFE